MVNSRVSLVFALALDCASGARADIWHAGDLTTYTGDNWGGHSGVDAGATLLVAS